MSKKRKPVPEAKMLAVLEDVAGSMGVGKSLKKQGIDTEAFYCTLLDPEWAKRYAQAKAAGVEALANDLLEIQDELPPLRSPGGESPGDAKVDVGWVQWQKNRVDTRKWLLSKLAARKYGDKVEATVSGPEGGPIETKVQVVEGLDGFRDRLLAVLKKANEGQNAD